MPTNTKYISVDRLSEFLTALRGKYAANALTGDYQVLHAHNAKYDGHEHEISIYYATVSALETLDGSAVKSISLYESGQDPEHGGSATTLSPSAGVVTLDLHDYALKSEISAALHFRGVVATQDLLPTSNVEVGDVYIVTTDSAGQASTEFVCTAVTPSITWEKLGPTVDYTTFVTKKTAANGYIATFNASGDVVSTGVLASKLEAGTVQQGDTHYVTCDQVNTVKEGLDKAMIKSVKVNGTALTPDANRAVDVSVPVLDVKLIGSGESSAASVLNTTTHEATLDLSAYALSADIPEEAPASDITAMFA